MNKPELTALMKMVGSTVREYVGVLAVKIADIQYKHEALDQRVKEIPAGQDGKDAVVDYGKVHALLKTEVEVAVKELPLPRDGAPGETGPAGVNGEKGDPGESIRGEKGEPGLSIKGDPGLSVIGPAGPVGPKGDPGESIRGPMGPTGDPGVSIKGDPGEMGPIGPVGPNGEPGESVRGEKGESGIQGVPGEIGEKGEPGLSIKGDKGDPGLNGKDADPIHPDTLSLMVVTAVAKEVAKAVVLIPKAVDGRDAMQLDILPDIDTHKSYPRGTVAYYAGGTIRAETTTRPITDGLEKAGWAVMMDGFDTFREIPSEDPRTITLEAKRTSGKTTIIERHIPFMLFKEVWQEGGDYVRGDTVQRSGSQWFCAIDGTKVAPGTPNNNDWVLTAKKGSPGKDMDPESMRAMIEIEVAKAVARLPKPRDGKDLTQMDPSGRKW